MTLNTVAIIAATIIILYAKSRLQKTRLYKPTLLAIGVIFSMAMLIALYAIAIMSTTNLGQ